jgi:hypothetical protein
MKTIQIHAIATVVVDVVEEDVDAHKVKVPREQI